MLLLALSPALIVCSTSFQHFEICTGYQFNIGLVSRSSLSLVEKCQRGEVPDYHPKDCKLVGKLHRPFDLRSMKLEYYGLHRLTIQCVTVPSVQQVRPSGMLFHHPYATTVSRAMFLSQLKMHYNALMAATHLWLKISPLSSSSSSSPPHSSSSSFIQLTLFCLNKWAIPPVKALTAPSFCSISFVKLRVRFWTKNNNYTKNNK